MLDLEAASKERHERFVRRVVASHEVWGLKSADGWVCTDSTAMGAEPRTVMPFWSDRAYANQCAKDEWADYVPTPIPLAAFMERWLPGMQSDECLVGTNWNAHLCGHEIEPRDLRQEIQQQLDSASGSA